MAKAAAAPSFKERLEAAASEARPAGPSNGQNYALVGLLTAKLIDAGVEGFDESLLTGPVSVRTRVGASGMIQVLKDELGIEDLRTLGGKPAAATS